MNEFQDLIDLAQLTLMEEHMDNALQPIIEHDAVVKVIDYKKRKLANKIISKTEA